MAETSHKVCCSPNNTQEIKRPTSHSPLQGYTHNDLRPPTRPHLLRVYCLPTEPSRRSCLYMWNFGEHSRLIPFMRAEFSWPYHLPKTLSHNTVTMGIVSTDEFLRDTNIQTITSTKPSIVQPFCPHRSNSAIFWCLFLHGNMLLWCPWFCP